VGRNENSSTAHDRTVSGGLGFGLWSVACGRAGSGPSAEFKARRPQSLYECIYI